MTTLNVDFAASLEEAIKHDWRGNARPEQLAPPETALWRVWLILAGRGWGKTHTGSEFIRENVCGTTPLGRGRLKQVALIAETAADARETMVGDGKAPGEGSGILQVCPKDFRPVYEPSKRRLTWPNGAIATLYNGSEPDALRGPQHDGAWCDELAKFQYAKETWDQLQFGLRLGQRPQVVVTTTPRPLPLLKMIMRDPGTIITRGRTADNAANLSPGFVEALTARYGGTRLGRQELDAEFLDDTPGALWQLDWLDRDRVLFAPDLMRIVVAVDPAVSTNENSDETGIMVAGIDARQHIYVLEDASGKYAPAEWAKRAFDAFQRHRADRIVAEVNQGGQMVETTLRAVGANVPFRAVHASRGKVTRAEPVSALYEQGKVHHVGANLKKLEDQMCAFTSDFDRSRSGYSPDRVDALVWALTELMPKASSGIHAIKYNYIGR